MLKLAIAESQKQLGFGFVVATADDITFTREEKVILDRARALLELGRVSFICNAIEYDWILEKNVLRPSSRKLRMVDHMVLAKIQSLLEYWTGDKRNPTYGSAVRFAQECGVCEMKLVDDRTGRIEWLTHLIDNC